MVSPMKMHTLEVTYGGRGRSLALHSCLESLHPFDYLDKSPLQTLFNKSGTGLWAHLLIEVGISADRSHWNEGRAQR